MAKIRAPGPGASGSIRRVDAFDIGNWPIKVSGCKTGEQEPCLRGAVVTANDMLVQFSRKIPQLRTGCAPAAAAGVRHAERLDGWGIAVD